MYREQLAQLLFIAGSLGVVEWRILACLITAHQITCASDFLEVGLQFRTTLLMAPGTCTGRLLGLATLAPLRAPHFEQPAAALTLELQFGIGRYRRHRHREFQSHVHQL